MRNNVKAYKIFRKLPSGRLVSLYAGPQDGQITYKKTQLNKNRPKFPKLFIFRDLGVFNWFCDVHGHNFPVERWEVTAYGVSDTDSILGNDFPAGTLFTSSVKLIKKIS